MIGKKSSKLFCGHVHACPLPGLDTRLEQRTREGRRQGPHRCEGPHPAGTHGRTDRQASGREGLSLLWLCPVPS